MSRANRRAAEREQKKKEQKAASLMHQLKKAARDGDQEGVQRVKDRLSELRNN